MAGQGERSIASVLSDIVGNVQQIVRAEFRLAAVEVRQATARAARAATLVIIGGAIATLALTFTLLAGVYLLATLVAPWIAALIVAAAAAIVGTMLIVAGMNQIQKVALTPPRTVATIEENIQWAKTPAK